MSAELEQEVWYPPTHCCPMCSEFMGEFERVCCACEEKVLPITIAEWDEREEAKLDDYNIDWPACSGVGYQGEI